MPRRSIWNEVAVICHAANVVLKNPGEARCQSLLIGHDLIWNDAGARRAMSCARNPHCSGLADNPIVAPVIQGGLFLEDVLVSILTGYPMVDRFNFKKLSDLVVRLIRPLSKRDG